MGGYVRLSITDVDRFCRDANTFKSDVNIGEGSRILDAKSLLALVTLDFTKNVKVEIISDDENEIKKFEELIIRYGEK